MASQSADIPREHITWEFEGRRFALDVPKGDRLATLDADKTSFPDIALLDEIRDLALPEGVFVDVGAHVGNHCLFFTKVMERSVVAYEPFPPARELLQSNVERNSTASLVKIMDCGLSNRFTWRTMDALPNVWTQAQLEGDREGLHGPYLFAPLDRIVPGDVSVALLQINARGHEFQVLEGARDTIKSSRPAVLVEVADEDALESAVALLHSYNYGCAGLKASDSRYLFLHRDNHRSLYDLSFEQLSKKYHRAASNGTRYLEYESLQRCQMEIDRLKSAMRATSRVAYLREKELYEKNVEVKAIKSALERAHSAYSDLFYELLPKKHQRRGRLYPRDLRAQNEKHVTSERRQATSQQRKALHFGYLTEPVEVDRPVRVGIAAIPSRTASLRETLSSLYDQVDEIYVYLNGFKEVPFDDFGDKVKLVLNDNVGDYAKFSALDETFSGYYLTCDDDIVYPAYYVRSIVYTLQRYEGRVFAGWHGAILKEPFTDYYTKSSRRVLPFYSLQSSHAFVHILGTGALGFDAAKIKPPYGIFEEPNMADVFLASYAQDEKIPMVLVPHDRGEARDVNHLNADSQSHTISLQSIDRSGKELDVRERVNERVGARRWELHKPAPERLRILLIGRFDTDRWKKGGILKSCHIMARMLEEIGHEVICAEIDDDYKVIDEVVRHTYDVGFVYTGDQRAQDFFNVERLLDETSDRTFPLFFNLSYDLRVEQNRVIEEQAARMDRRDGIFVFTDDAKRDVERLAENQVLVIPKTITVPNNRQRDAVIYEQTSGVFCGDLSKFLNPEATPHAEELFTALRAVVPINELNFVTQYQVDELPGYMDGVKVHSYSEDIHQVIRQCCVYVHLNQWRTFEMLPVESMLAGVPVMYIRMPQSLDTYIGDAGVRFEDADELESRLPALLFDKEVWTAYAERGRMRADSINWEAKKPELSIALRELGG